MFEASPKGRGSQLLCNLPDAYTQGSRTIIVVGIMDSARV